MRVALPNGVDVLSVSTRNVIENLRAGFVPRTVLPPVFRLARLVTSGAGPLRVTTEEER